jgi:hypothetical protein
MLDGQRDTCNKVRCEEDVVERSALLFRLAWVFPLSMLALHPTTVDAQEAAITTSATCEFLEDDCATVDSTAALNSLTISVNSKGVWKATCHGTTTVKPSTSTHCVGEKLNTGTERVPINACGLEVSSGVTTGPVFTDDWNESITPAGKVTLICTFNPREKGK